MLPYVYQHTPNLAIYLEYIHVHVLEMQIGTIIIDLIKN